MAMSRDEILSLLKQSFPQGKVVLQDYQGDRDHYALKIYAPEFQGLSRLQQHRLVYDALGPKMGNDLHALTIKTVTSPDQASEEQVG